MRGSVHLVSVCVCVCVCVLCVCSGRGLWLMGSLLMLSQDYRWLQWLDTDLTSVQIYTHTTHMHAHAHRHTLSLPLPLSRTQTHTHTHFHFFQALIGTLMHINLPLQLINLLIQTVLLRPSLFLSHTHTHTHTDSHAHTLAPGLSCLQSRCSANSGLN